MLNITDSNNSINEKIENNNQILTPPLTPLTPRTLVQPVEGNILFIYLFINIIFIL